MRIQIVDFEGEKYAFVQEQNDWTGNYIVKVRKVRGSYGEEFIRHNGYKLDVSKDVEAERKEHACICDALEFCRKYRDRV